MSCRLYSCGHSTRTLDELVELLHSAGVERVVDVRRFPGSRRNPQHNRGVLERELPGGGIDYVWLGDTLGGMRSGSYEDWMATPAFDGGLADLERLGAECPTAYMCAEAAPTKCHRRFIARALAGRGHTTVHLIAPGHVEWEETPLQAPD